MTLNVIGFNVVIYTSVVDNYMDTRVVPALGGPPQYWCVTFFLIFSPISQH